MNNTLNLAYSWYHIVMRQPSIIAKAEWLAVEYEYLKSRGSK